MRLPIYLDNNATTRTDPRVVEAMLPYFSEVYGNAASRTHAFGWAAAAAVETSREHVARIIGAEPRDIVWTSGATESNNLAIFGVARRSASRGRHVITSTVEHKAVLDPMLELEREGFEVTRLDPDSEGRVDPEAVRRATRDDTVLVSLMLANNEIGTLNPIAAIGAGLAEHPAALHVDAAQAVGKIPVDVTTLGADLLSISAHKFYGPKGVGALYVRRAPHVKLSPLIHGGGHERGLRSGTLNVPLLVGMGAAASIAEDEIERETARTRPLAARLEAGIRERITGVHRNGNESDALPGLVNLRFDGIEGSALLLSLPELALSTGSACTSARIEPSHVLTGIGLSKSAAHSAVRFGIGRFTTAEEVEFTILRVATQVERLRAHR